MIPKHDPAERLQPHSKQIDSPITAPWSSRLREPLFCPDLIC